MNNRKKVHFILLFSFIFLFSTVVRAEERSTSTNEISSNQSTKSSIEEYTSKQDSSVQNSTDSLNLSNSNVIEDPYFPKNPSTKDIEGDKVKPGDLKNNSEKNLSLFKLRSAKGREINNTIYSKLENGEYQRASIQQSWREYAVFPYKSKDDINKEVYAPSGIVVHETANPNSTIWNEIAYMDQHWDNAFVHAFVDRGNIVEIHNPIYGGWGAGRVANRYFIHVELVEHVNSLDDFRRSILNDAYYMAVKLRQFGLTPSRPKGIKNDLRGTIWSHKEVSLYLGGTNHVDPDGYFAKFGYTMDDYYNLVEQEYNNLSPVSVDASIQTNPKNGTAIVTIRTDDDTSLDRISVPVWSISNPKAIKWYDAKKVAPNEYRVDIDYANHQYLTGQFNAHLYTYEKGGRSNSINIGPMDLNAIPLKVTTNTQSNQQTGQAVITIKTNDDSNLEGIRVPVWPTSNPKAIKWYDAIKVKANEYRVDIDYANHQYLTGQFNAHLYTYTKNGNARSTNIGPLELSAESLKTETKIVSNPKNGTAIVTIRTNDDTSLDRISVPVWSISNPKAIKWYDAVKVKSNEYRVDIDYANHQYRTGQFNAHLYTYEKGGRSNSINIGPMDLNAIPLKVTTNTQSNQQTGQAVITIKTNDDSNLEGIRVPVWPTSNPKAIKWYDAVKVKSNEYRVHVNYANHQYRTGQFDAHLYTYEKGGRSNSINIGPINLK